jgi:hypothetical protein
MRAKRNWDQVRSPHARFLEGLEAAVAAHPSASARGGAVADEGSRSERARLTIVGSTADNVIPMPTRRTPRSKGRPTRGGSPAA